MPVRWPVPLDWENFQRRNLKGIIAPKDHFRIKLAFELMDMAHDGQFRETGEPYKAHPIRVVERLRIAGFEDPAIFVVGLLHDVNEDAKERMRIWLIETLPRVRPELANIRNRSTTDMYEKLFGVKAFRDIKALSKVEPIDDNYESKQFAEIKTLDNVARGSPVVWLVKLSDRLDNVVTLPLHPDDPARLEKDLDRIRRKLIETRRDYWPIFEDAVAWYPMAKTLLVALDRRCNRLARTAG